MSMPDLPENNVNREEAVNLILTSIAMEELGLSHILNAEGEKMQYVLGTAEGRTGPGDPPTIKDILDVNKSVRHTLSNATRLQMMLGAKMESAMSAGAAQGATGPQGPTGPVGVILASYNTLEDLMADHETGNQGDAYLVGGNLYVWDTDTGQWKNIGTLTGPVGPEGPMGPVGVILGSYNSLQELEDAHETGNQGDAYLVGGDLYVWNTDTEEWKWVGNLQGPQGPMGARGLDGQEGPQGPQGAQGIQGEAGIVGTIRGSYDTEQELRDAHPEGGEPGEFYYINPNLWVWDDVNNDWLNVGQIAGPQGIQGIQGERGEAGPQGEIGPVGIILGSFDTVDALKAEYPIGNQGEAYLVAGDLYVWKVVSESWERVGTLQGPTGAEGPEGPQGPAGAPVEAYHFNLSTSGSNGEATVGNVIFRLANVNNTSISLYIRPVSSPVMIDFARSTFYNIIGGAVETYFQDNYELSVSLGIDTVIYSQSNELQKSWLRQRNPNGTWSLCEYSIFASNNASRVTLWINWIYQDVLMP